MEQVLAINNSLEEARSDVKETRSDQPFLAVININMSSGCEQRVDEGTFTVSFSNNVVDYIDEVSIYLSALCLRPSNAAHSSPQTHVIVDSTCEVEKNATQALEGVGVTTVSLKPGSSNINISDTFSFLSNAELQCTCNNLRVSFSSLFDPPFYICRHITLRCPYTIQGINSTINI